MKRIIRIVLLSFVICILGLNLTACSSVEKKGMSTGFTVVSCTYNSNTNETKIIWSSTLNNESIYDITQVFFKFDLYKNNSLIRTTDNVYWDIQIGHGQSNYGNRSFSVEGEIDDVAIYNWNADFSNLWDSYEGWWIGTIIGMIVLLICFLAFFLLDVDIEDIAWVAYFIIPLLIGVGISGIIGWISANWVSLCIVAGGLIGCLVIIGIIALVMRISDEFCWGIQPIYVVLTIFGIVLLGSIVCGFIFWEWWAMLIIIGSLVALIVAIVLIKNKKSASLNQNNLECMTVENLKYQCSMYGIKGYSKLKKSELIEKLINYGKESVDEKNISGADTGSIVADTHAEKMTHNLKKVSLGSKKGKITFDSIAGLDNVKEIFKEKVILPFEHPEIFEKFGKKAGGGILLYGLPGTGKTMFAEAASNELDAKFISIKCSDIKSKWYGESEQKVKSIFKEAKKYEKAIIFFDEFEAIGTKRTDNENNINNNLVPEILAEMQGVGSSKSNSTIMIIAATNKPWAIDSAFMRPGRFDEKIYIPLPDFEARKTLFNIKLKKLPVEDDLDYDYLAKITEGFNGADITEFCEKLKMSAIKDSLAKGEEQTIGMDDVRRVKGTIKSSVSMEDIEQLKKFEDKD